MIQQYFTELQLKVGVTLSEGLEALVNEAEGELESEYMEVVQVIKHDPFHYTVILNVDYPDDEDEKEEEDEDSGDGSGSKGGSSKKK
ncbi:hypothetical protein J31TS4_00010 [Paenibacillus sp. J31TS4]|uniref:hypothetical protein n=1 Tax=Paenibacillus sp. J31TS4 TaxID=2807195 RepID=UPI001B2E6324|nr:hypothetical protein [Paenibacillus sp. J31TS4]GIP36721.1 hypothetical protein J31TS4_00010 [Paenibacillus sp. J31TS4]